MNVEHAPYCHCGHYRFDHFDHPRSHPCGASPKCECKKYRRVWWWQK